MEKDIAPFKVGDEVICVESKTASSGYGSIRKGDIYIVQGIWQCLVCKGWKIDIGITSHFMSGCRKCFCLSEIQGPVYANVKLFRRLERYPDATKEILEKFPLHEGPEVDTPIRKVEVTS